MRNLLIIYVSRTWPMRASQRDHLWSFQRYAKNCRCFYVNVAFHGVPTYLEAVKFDMVIFHWLFVGTRVDRDWFKRALKRIENVKRFSGMKVTMPQDEFVSMDLLCNMINDFDVKTVYSVAPSSEWSKIYCTVDTNRTSFIRVLTGYLDERLVQKWSVLAEQKTERAIDIGYRTVSQAIWGRFNLIKGQIAEVFEITARDHGLRTDIAVGAEHFKMGDEWLQFLATCRYTLGIEGGSSLLDWDGSISRALYVYLDIHPDANFDELERECLPPGKDGEIAVVAISPRHLEACLTRTGQVLIEGDYNGVLRQYDHYIPLKRDFSNLLEVLDLMKDESRRSEMVSRAYRDVVLSAKYTYRHMVHAVLDVLPEVTCRRGGDNMLHAITVSHLHAIAQMAMVVDIAFVYIYSRVRDARNSLCRYLRRRRCTP